MTVSLLLIVNSPATKTAPHCTDYLICLTLGLASNNHHLGETIHFAAIKTQPVSSQVSNTRSSLIANLRCLKHPIFITYMTQIF
jgi:hypothetical protein